MTVPDPVPEIRTIGVARSWTWTRCYLAGDPATRQAILIDPATTDGKERSLLRRSLLDGWKVTCIVLTHGHPDHISDASYWRSELGAPLAGHPADKPLFLSASVNSSGAFGREVSIESLDIELADGQVLEAGGLSFEVMSLPGHSPGSIGIYTPGHLFSGDTLFAGSVGVDSIPGIGPLWGASLETEICSIRERIFALPDGTLVHPGHGPDTTVGTEKATNPFAGLP
jgi:hydroxyacylglutathione hydrolase